MEEEVNYKLTLSDLLTGKLHAAAEAGDALEETLERVEKVAGALGVGFAVFEIGEYIKDAGEKFEGLEKASAKTEANLEATGEKAGVSTEMLTAWAKELRGITGESLAILTDAESQLLTFPTITKANFRQAMAQVVDIAKQTNHEVTETAIMYGKALADPAEGLQKLQRYGVILSAQEKARIEQLEATNGKVAAQKALMESIAHSGYEGVAASMFNADPLNRYKLVMEDTQMEVGRLATELKRALAPALEVIAEDLREGLEGAKELAHWLYTNREAIQGLAEMVAIATAAYVAFEAWQRITYMWMMRESIQTAILIVLKGGLTSVTGVLTGAVTALNAAWAANPIGLVVISVVALGAALYAGYQHIEKVRGGLWAVWGAIKAYASLVRDVFVGWFDIFTGNVSEGINKLSDVLVNGVKRIAEGAKEGYNAGIADFHATHSGEKIVAKEGKPGKAGAKGAEGDMPAPSKASGTKSITITININKLIEKFEINANHISESYGKIQEHVANAILAAANDASLNADI